MSHDHMIICTGFPVAILARDIRGAPRAPDGWGGWPGVDPLGIVTGNKEVVAVTILGAPHRWEGGIV